MIQFLIWLALLLGQHPTEFICSFPKPFLNAFDIECHCEDCDGGEAPEGEGLPD